jgi:hypothetical protein
MIFRRFLSSALLLGLAIFPSCDEKSGGGSSEESSKEGTDEETLETEDKVGTLAIDGCESATDCAEKIGTNLGIAIGNVKNIETSQQPGALAVSAGTQLTADDEPDISGCFNKDGGHPGACQPVSLRFYLWLAGKPLETVSEVLGGAVDEIKKNLNANTGVIPLEGSSSLFYSATSVTKFDILLTYEDRTIFFRIDGINYHLRFKGPDEGSVQYVNADITYTSESEWTSYIRTDSEDCSVMPPIAIRNHRKGMRNIGQAMLKTYKDSDNCTVAAKGDAAWYTDFIGDDNFFTASMYWLPTSTDPKTVKLEDFGYDSLCKNVSDHEICDWASEEFLGGYKNPYCIPKGQGDALLGSDDFGKSCNDSKDADIAAPNFMEQSQFLHPDTELDLDVKTAKLYCIPADLEGASLTACEI